MKILILGNDGYIGWPLSLHLKNLGHEAIGIDNCSRRGRVEAIGSASLTPINHDGVTTYYGHIGRPNSYDQLVGIFADFQPDTIVHLAEQPSAPWSMIDHAHACITQFENVLGTLQVLWAMKESCPDAHLVKLGSMGEYGTPDCDIPEGVIPGECLANRWKAHWETVDFDCPMSSLPFPKSPHSFYHLSKVHDTNNIIFACKTWGLRSTDIMQGVVYGLIDKFDEPLTRFDYDQYFGTVINRFCVQAIINYPLTVYGSGGQTRGFLALKDSIQCLALAIENPPTHGEYRTFNQFGDIKSVFDLAKIVVKAAYELGIGAQIKHLPNPRVEKEKHYYQTTNKNLLDLGYEPTTDTLTEVKNLITTILPYKDNVIEEVINPTTTWK